MNDPKTVIQNLRNRWMSKYGEDIGSEEIRRHLSKMLSDLQRRELDAVFSNWSGEDLLQAINATFDLDEPAIEAPSVMFTLDDNAEPQTPIEPAKKPRGRPRKIK